jgi:catechol 2,3-dioxygenase-like lactoylglutathione lyase family enzyme
MNRAAPLATTITLGVPDLRREVAFYRDLGWPLVFESEDSSPSSYAEPS